jgi:hypothetical protein
MNDRRGEASEESLVEFLNAGSEITGSLAAATIGLLIAGPPGALAGAAASPVLARTIRGVALEFAGRMLSQRERVKAASVIEIAANRIQEKIQLGYELRSDDFLVSEPGRRSVADEVAEGVLISAQREHEERKLPYLGNLLANIAFEDDLNRSQANLLLRLADRLSYRQLCLLAIFGRKDEFPDLRDGTFEDQFENEPAAEGFIELIGVLEEANELMVMGLLMQPRRTIMGWGSELNPANVQPYRWGALLYEVMDLSDLPAAELLLLAETLR